MPSSASSSSSSPVGDHLLDNSHQPDEHNDNIPFIGNNDPLITTPGSPIGSPIRSYQVSSFDTTEGNASMTSWRLGMPWFRTGSTTNPKTALVGLSRAVSGESVNTQSSSSSSKKQRRKSRRNKASDRRKNEEDKHDLYYGGIMKPSGHNKGNNKKDKAVHNNKNNSSEKVVPSRSQDSIGDFDNSEWTPEDSSYGAACPVCGCIPKNVRRGIEFSMISILVLAFVYVLVITSINVSDARRSGRFSVDNNQNYTQSNNNNQNAVTDDNMNVEDNALADDDTNGGSNGDDMYNNAYINNEYTDDYNNHNNNNGNAYSNNGGSGYNYNYYNNNNNGYQYNNNGGRYYRYYNNNNGGGGGGRKHQRERIRRQRFLRSSRL